MVRRQEPVLLQSVNVPAEAHASEVTRFVESPGSPGSRSTHKFEDKKAKLEGEKSIKRHQRNKKHSSSSQNQPEHKDKSKKHSDAAKKDADKASDGLEVGSAQKCKFFLNSYDLNKNSGVGQKQFLFI